MATASDRDRDQHAGADGPDQPPVDAFDEETAPAAGEGAGARPADAGQDEGAGEAVDYAAVLAEMTPEALADLHTRVSERDLYLEHLKRLQAEMENLKKRHERDKAEWVKYASINLVRDMLPVLDNLRRAADVDDPTQAKEGIAMIESQFEKALAAAGAIPIEAEGNRFDPNFHEAMMAEPSADHPDQTVLAEFVRGYKMHDRVVRPAQVKVSTRPAGS